MCDAQHERELLEGLYQLGSNSYAHTTYPAVRGRVHHAHQCSAPPKPAVHRSGIGASPFCAAAGPAWPSTHSNPLWGPRRGSLAHHPYSQWSHPAHGPQRLPSAPGTHLQYAAGVPGPPHQSYTLPQRAVQPAPGRIGWDWSGPVPGPPSGELSALGSAGAPAHAVAEQPLQARGRSESGLISAPPQLPWEDDAGPHFEPQSALLGCAPAHKERRMAHAHYAPPTWPPCDGMSDAFGGAADSAADEGCEHANSLPKLRRMAYATYSGGAAEAVPQAAQGPYDSGATALGQWQQLQQQQHRLLAHGASCPPTTSGAFDGSLHAPVPQLSGPSAQAGRPGEGGTAEAALEGAWAPDAGSGHLVRLAGSAQPATSELSAPPQLPYGEVDMDAADYVKSAPLPAFRSWQPAAATHAMRSSSAAAAGDGAADERPNSVASLPDAMASMFDSSSGPPLPQPVRVQVASKSRRKAAEDDGSCSVTRGAMGTFHPRMYLTGGDCIECNGEMMSRGRFERLAGTATAKWHVSIKVLPSGATLGRWLQQHGLPVLQGKPRKRRAGAGDADEEGEDEPDGCSAYGLREYASAPLPAGLVVMQAADSTPHPRLTAPELAVAGVPGAAEAAGSSGGGLAGAVRHHSSALPRGHDPLFTLLEDCGILDDILDPHALPYAHGPAPPCEQPKLGPVAARPLPHHHHHYRNLHHSHHSRAAAHETAPPAPAPSAPDAAAAACNRGSAAAQSPFCSSSQNVVTSGSGWVRDTGAPVSASSPRAPPAADPARAISVQSDCTPSLGFGALSVGGSCATPGASGAASRACWSRSWGSGAASSRASDSAAAPALHPDAGGGPAGGSLGAAPPQPGHEPTFAWPPVTSGTAFGSAAGSGAPLHGYGRRSSTGNPPLPTESSPSPFPAHDVDVERFPAVAAWGSTPGQGWGSGGAAQPPTVQAGPGQPYCIADYAPAGAAVGPAASGKAVAGHWRPVLVQQHPQQRHHPLRAAQQLPLHVRLLPQPGPRASRHPVWAAYAQPEAPAYHASWNAWAEQDLGPDQQQQRWPAVCPSPFPSAPPEYAQYPAPAMAHQEPRC